MWARQQVRIRFPRHREEVTGPRGAPVFSSVYWVCADDSAVGTSHSGLTMMTLLFMMRTLRSP